MTHQKPIAQKVCKLTLPNGREIIIDLPEDQVIQVAYISKLPVHGSVGEPIALQKEVK